MIPILNVDDSHVNGTLSNKRIIGHTSGEPGVYPDNTAAENSNRHQICDQKQDEKQRAALYHPNYRCDFTRAQSLRLTVM